jgi:hypothetical protein
MAKEKAPPAEENTPRPREAAPPDAAIENIPFNRDARASLEEGYEAFTKAEAAGEATGEQIVIHQEPVPAQKTEVPAAAPIEDTQSRTMDVPEQKFETTAPTERKFKHETIEDYDKAYKEAERKMHQASRRAAELENQMRLMAAREAQIAEAVRLAQEQERIQRSTRQPEDDLFTQGEPTEEEIKRLEDELLERPGYAQAKMKREILQEAMRIADKISDKKLEHLKATARQNAEQRKAAEARKRESDTVGTYFRETYKDLVPLEAVVTDEMQHVWQDGEFMRPLADSGLDLIGKAKRIMDETARRVREKRIPEIMSSLGASASTETTQRLSAPPVAVGSNTAGGARPVAPVGGESPQEYIQNRLRRQEKMLYGKAGP